MKKNNHAIQSNFPKKKPKDQNIKTNNPRKIHAKKKQDDATRSFLAKVNNNTHAKKVNELILSIKNLIRKI